MNLQTKIHYGNRLHQGELKNRYKETMMRTSPKRLIIKRAFLLLVLAGTISALISFVLATISCFHKTHIKTNLSTDLTIAPGAAALVLDDIVSSDTQPIYLKGSYELIFKGDGARLHIVGKSLSVAKMLHPQVHVAEGSIAESFETNCLFVKGLENKIEIFSYSPDFDLRGLAIPAPCVLSHTQESGEFIFGAQAFASALFSAPTVRFVEFPENYIRLTGSFIPLDTPGTRILVMPLGNFRLIYKKSPESYTQTQAFKGQFMRNKGWHFASFVPWLDTEIDCLSTHMVSYDAPVTSMLNITASIAQVLKLASFTGYYVLGEDKSPGEGEAIARNWELQDITSLDMGIHFAEGSRKDKIKCQVEISANCKTLLIDGTDRLSFVNKFKASFVAVWQNAYFLGIFLIVIGILITSWLKEERGRH